MNPSEQGAGTNSSSDRPMHTNNHIPCPTVSNTQLFSHLNQVSEMETLYSPADTGIRLQDYTVLQM